MTTKCKWLCAAAILACAGGALADAAPISEPDYEAGRQQIEVQYEADRRSCKALKDRARDICDRQAQGRRKSETARLEARHRPSPEAVQEAKVATAEAHHEIAMERCKALKGKARSRCQDEADAALEAATRQARVEKVDAQREAQAKAREAAARARKAAGTGQS